MKKFGDNKIMRIFAVHFLSSRQRLMDAEAEFLGFKAVRQQKCQVRTHLHQKTLPQAESYFFPPAANLPVETLPSLVHVLVVAEILAACHVVKPVTILKVPAHGLLDALGELKARLPAQFPFQFR